MMTPSSSSTRDRIITEARRLFSENGFHSTSIANILQAAEANAGSLYYFFPSKQDLLLAVLDTYQQGIYPMLLDPVWRGIPDPIERIFGLLAGYREALERTDFFFGCPIGSLALELHEPDPEVQDALAANFSAWTSAIEQCLADAAHRLPEDVDRAGLATFVLTTMEGSVMLARTYRNLKRFDAGVRQLREHVAALEAKATKQSASVRADA